MGDISKCGVCSTYHYRNDPCVEVPQSNLTYCSQCLSDCTFDELRHNEGRCRVCYEEGQKLLKVRQTDG